MHNFVFSRDNCNSKKGAKTVINVVATSRHDQCNNEWTQETAAAFGLKLKTIIWGIIYNDFYCAIQMHSWICYTRAIHSSIMHKKYGIVSLQSYLIVLIFCRIWICWNLFFLEFSCSQFDALKKLFCNLWIIKPSLLFKDIVYYFTSNFLKLSEQNWETTKASRDLDIIRICTKNINPIILLIQYLTFYMIQWRRTVFLNLLTTIKNYL